MFSRYLSLRGSAFHLSANRGKHEEPLETKGVGSIVVSSLGCRERGKRPWTRAAIRAVLAAIALWPSGPVSADPALCVPPAVPVLPSDPAAQRDYRDVLSIQYDEYFILAGQYLTCLNDASSQARQEVNDAIRDYQRLLKVSRRQSSDDVEK